MKFKPDLLRWPAWITGLQRPTKYLLWSIGLFTLMAVTGMGWFQYRQIDRITLSAERGRDNLIWDFYKLELQLTNVQLSLHRLMAQADDQQQQDEFALELNIFASQIQLLETINSGQVMRAHNSFGAAMQASTKFISLGDEFVDKATPGRHINGVQQLLQASEQLRVPIHRLVLDAYLVENERANGRFRDIRQFTTYYGLTSTFLIFLTLWVGWLVMRSLSLTERRHADQRQQLQDKHDMAEASARAKSRFLSSASHDLRQPAHALGLFVSQLTPMVTEPGAKHLVACANAAALDLQRMLDGLFDLSRLEAEATQIQIQNFALEDVFEQLRSGFAADASAKGLRLRVRHTRAWVRTDPVLLQRILLNLLGNALRYTEHGSVLVAARRSADAGSVRIEVRDSGIGIAPPDHENIFQEFYQVANAQRDRRNGLGLGLSIAQRCARLLDLPLSLRSDLGCGSCFTLSVPVVASQLEPEADDASQGLVPNELLGLHVLVIDDDPMGLEALAGLLASWGCVVTSAEGMQAALLHYSLEPWPDVIVTDYRMAEGHNGLDAIETLRAVSGKHIAACVVSGDTDPAVAQQVKTAGLVLLKKPVRPAKLRGLLRNLVRPR